MTTAGSGDLDIDGLRNVAMDNVAGFSVGRQSEQLVDQRTRDANWMAMLARIVGTVTGARSARNRAASVSSVEISKMRMIDGQKHRGVGIGWNQSQSTLERAEHAAIGIGIDGEDDIAAALDAGSDLVRVLARRRR